VIAVFMAFNFSLFVAPGNLILVRIDSGMIVIVVMSFIDLSRTFGVVPMEFLRKVDRLDFRRIEDVIAVAVHVLSLVDDVLRLETLFVLRLRLCDLVD
jgi:hypothetical protein